MYLLYIDESGNPDNPADKHFVLGGVAVFERQTFFLSNALNKIQEAHFPGQPPIEFHATEIRAGKGFWRTVEREKRTAILDDVCKTGGGFNADSVVYFSVAIEKNDKIYGEKAVEVATEEICRRFDIFLMDRHHHHNDTQRGLIVFAEGRFHDRARIWVKGFRELGTKWGVLKNLADIPYFATTKENRLLQLADVVSHATYLIYEKNDASLMKLLLPRFSQQRGTIHGLAHICTPRRDDCTCPACHSRRIPGNFGPLITPTV